ncbi:MAG TPA: hypothetical protein VM077_05310 [Candidatus Limnocylindrales bacterium]|nr:hypothetical protein [Candidatus Limnocylindrales bacterium]
MTEPRSERPLPPEIWDGPQSRKNLEDLGKRHVTRLAAIANGEFPPRTRGRFGLRRFGRSFR